MSNTGNLKGWGGGVARDGVARDRVGDIVDGVRDLVLGVVEGDDGVKAAYVPLVITPEMRERIARLITPEMRESFNRPVVFSPELMETFTRHWFEKGVEGGSPPIAASFQQYGLGQIFNLALDCFNQGSAFHASNSAGSSTSARAVSTRATTD